MPRLPFPPIRFMNKKKALIIGLTLLSIFLAFKFWPVRGPISAQTKVERRNLETFIEASGKLKASREVTLSFPLLGNLEMVASSSSRVKKGEIVARLKTQDLWASLQQAYAALNKARSSFYYYLEVKSQTDTASAWKEDATSKALVNQANNNVAAAQDGVEAARFAVDGARAAYNKAFLKAPFDGVVGDSTLSVGETVSPGQKVLKIVAPGAFYFETEVDETEVVQLKLGQTAQVKLDALPQTIFEGKISQIDPSARATASGGTSYAVKVDLTTNGSAPNSGFNGEVKFLREKKEGVLYAPANFIFSERDASFVWATANGRRLKKEVTLGEFFDGGYEILSGVSEGDLLSAPVKK